MLASDPDQRASAALAASLYSCPATAHDLPLAILCSTHCAPGVMPLEQSADGLALPIVQPHFRGALLIAPDLSSAACRSDHLLH